MRTTALIIGTPETCARLEQQIALLPEARRPVALGRVLVSVNRVEAADSVVKAHDHRDEPHPAPVLGTLDELEAVVARRRPGLALVMLPAAMGDLVTRVRTRLRKLGVPDRFMPTLEDQIAGIGPRSNLSIDPSRLLDRPPKKMDAEAVRAVIDGRRVLITGAGGSIGGELVRLVSQFHPAEVALMERSENALFEVDRQLARCAPNLPRRTILHDVVDAPQTMAWLTELRPEVVFHAAAHKHVPMMEDHPAAAVDNNLFGTKAVADAARAVGVERFVLISTDKAVNPVSIMGATKRLAELYVQSISRESSTGFSIVRFGNVLASTGSVLRIWSEEIAEGGPVTVTDPRMTRYFMTISEAAALVIQSAALVDESIPGADVFLLDMGEPIRILDLAKRYIELHGLTPRLTEDEFTAETRNHEASTEGRRDDECGRRPISPGTGPASVTPSVAHPSPHAFGPGIDLVFTGARPGEKLHEDLAFDSETMRPTRHPDVHIWSVPTPDPRFAETMIDRLSPERRPRSPEAVARAVRRLLRPARASAAA